MVSAMSQEDLMNCTISHEIHQYLFSSVYILVLLVGVPSNLYSLYHAVLQLRQKNELGVYLLNLTLSDLLYLASLPLWLQYFFQGDDWRHREWLCQLCGFLLYENIYISIGFLCCISLDRYLAVVHPLRFSSLRSMRAAWLASALIWLKEVAVGMVFFHHKELSRDGTNQSVCFEHYPMQHWEYPINYYRFSIGFLFPLAILTVSYLCVLRAVGRSTGTQPEQKNRIRQLVSSTVLIFLVCFSPYHVFLLVRTLLERDCNFIAGIFNYYHLSLLLTSLNCVADPALYCFVSESARRGVYRIFLKPVARILCCCRRRGNASPAHAATDSREVATDESNGHPSVTLLTHTSTHGNNTHGNNTHTSTHNTHTSTHGNHTYTGAPTEKHANTHGNNTHTSTHGNHTYAGAHTETHTNTHTEKHTNTHAEKHTSTHTSTHGNNTYTSTHGNNTYAGAHTETHTNTHPEKHTNTHAERHTNTHAEKHTNTHAEKHTNSHAEKHTNSHAEKHTKTHAEKHTNTHTEKHTNAHTKTHMVSQTSRQCAAQLMGSSHVVDMQQDMEKTAV